VLCGVIGCVGDDGVSKCGFSIDGGFKLVGVPWMAMSK
jgi:hypothetical protein